MTFEILRNTLAWSAVINLALLLWWVLFFIMAHDYTYRLHCKWFNLSLEKFDAIHYRCMATYLMGTLLLNLVPYLAMRVVG